MELEDLRRRLGPFCCAMYEDGGATVGKVWTMPGHAGFAYGFDVVSRGVEESWFLRLPPPNVNWRGTADVLRQVAALSALEGTEVPHCTVRWSGDDLQWFDRPYFIVPKLDGDVVRTEEGGWVRDLDDETRTHMAQKAMKALAGIHKVDWRRAGYLGAPVEFRDDVERWDRFVPKAADPERLTLVPKVRQRLLDTLPSDVPIGICHGDFQWANLFFSFDGTLLAVIDWELTGIGATLNDVGWIATFNDPGAWADNRGVGGVMPEADDLVELYRSAYGAKLPDLGWFRALAAYKFAIITGFNLMLHRRGKRPDPSWEYTKESVEPLLQRAYELLG
jgi:aminoglycoside phosphotransferase (APT) family kinase protein